MTSRTTVPGSSFSHQQPSGAGPVTCKHLLGLLLCIVGCGAPAPPHGSVSGRVTFAGQAVPNATVVFETTNGQLTVTADADEAGIYQARRSAEIAGLPPGEYRLAVTPPLFYPGLGPAGAAPPERADIPQKYRNVATSGLSLTVMDGADHPCDIPMVP